MDYPIGKNIIIDPFKLCNIEVHTNIESISSKKEKNVSNFSNIDYNNKHEDTDECNENLNKLKTDTTSNYKTHNDINRTIYTKPIEKIDNNIVYENKASNKCNTNDNTNNNVSEKLNNKYNNYNFNYKNEDLKKSDNLNYNHSPLYSYSKENLIVKDINNNENKLNKIEENNKYIDKDKDVIQYKENSNKNSPKNKYKSDKFIDKYKEFKNFADFNKNYKNNEDNSIYSTNNRSDISYNNIYSSKYNKPNNNEEEIDKLEKQFQEINSKTNLISDKANSNEYKNNNNSPKYSTNLNNRTHNNINDSIPKYNKLEQDNKDLKAEGFSNNTLYSDNSKPNISKTPLPNYNYSRLRDNNNFEDKSNNIKCTNNENNDLNKDMYINKQSTNIERENQIKERSYNINKISNENSSSTTEISYRYKYGSNFPNLNNTNTNNNNLNFGSKTPNKIYSQNLNKFKDTKSNFITDESSNKVLNSDNPLLKEYERLPSNIGRLKDPFENINSKEIIEQHIRNKENTSNLSNVTNKNDTSNKSNSRENLVDYNFKRYTPSTMSNFMNQMPNNNNEISFKKFNLCNNNFSNFNNNVIENNKNNSLDNKSEVKNKTFNIQDSSYYRNGIKDYDVKNKLSNIRNQNIADSRKIIITESNEK